MSTDSVSPHGSFCCIQDFENYALKTLPKPIADYYAGGSFYQETLSNNKDAYKKLRIKPRILVDVSERDLSTTILGTRINLPIGISPTAMQKCAHPDGECGNARAAGTLGTIFTLSTMSTTSLENVAKAAPNTTKWFQLYIYKDRQVSQNIVKRAEKAGYKAIVLTVDANVFGIRYSDMRNTFSLPPHLKLENFTDIDKSAMGDIKTRDESGLNKYVFKMFDESIQWKDVTWLKSITKLPIVLKGILTAEDALLAVKHGADAIIVSNHGGRQLDTAPATIEALPEITKVAGEKLEIYLDGGVRSGADIFKALALGAKMVFVGRPALWGLTHSGETGVKNVLQIFKNEFQCTMGLAGCVTVHDIKKEMVVHESYYHKL